MQHRVPSKTRLGYAQIAPGDGRLDSRPDDFIALGVTGHDGRDDAKVPEQLICSPVRAPMYLDRIPISDEKGSMAFASVLAPDSWASGAGQPFMPITGVFQGQADTNMQVFVMLSGELRKQRFQIPPFNLEPANKMIGPWTVVVYVEVGEDGQAGHVFLESGCGDKGINDAAVKIVARGKIANPGVSCSGRITINYGSR
jgi:hypothetical protein